MYNEDILYNGPFDSNSELDRMARKVNMQNKVNNEFDNNYINLKSGLDMLEKEYPSYNKTNECNYSVNAFKFQSILSCSISLKK